MGVILLILGVIGITGWIINMITKNYPLGENEVVLFIISIFIFIVFFVISINLHDNNVDIVRDNGIKTEIISIEDYNINYKESYIEYYYRNDDGKLDNKTIHLSDVDNLDILNLEGNNLKIEYYPEYDDFWFPINKKLVSIYIY